MHYFLHLRKVFINNGLGDFVLCICKEQEGRDFHLTPPIFKIMHLAEQSGAPN